jgi:hypothetical protein
MELSTESGVVLDLAKFVFRLRARGSSRAAYGSVEITFGPVT